MLNVFMISLMSLSMQIGIPLIRTIGQRATLWLVGERELDATQGKIRNI
jgi:hypothetical protein